MPSKVIGGKVYTYAEGTTPEELAALIAADPPDVADSAQTARENIQSSGLDRLVQRLLGDKAHFWPDVKAEQARWPKGKNPLEPTLAPGETRSPEELQDMLKGVIEAAGMAAVPGIGPKMVKQTPPGARKRSEVQRQFPSARQKPTDFSVLNMEALTPEARAEMRGRASDSELRWELAGRGNKERLLRGELADKGIGVETPATRKADEASLFARGIKAAEREKEMTSMLLKLPKEDVLKAEESAKRTAQMWRRMGVPFAQAFEESFYENLRARLGFDKEKE